MSFETMLEVPFIKKDISFPRLTIRSIGVLAGKYKKEHEEKIRETLDKEKITVDQKARFLAMTALPDPSIEHIMQWACTINGQIKIVTQSILQSGKTQEDADKIIDKFGHLELEEVAMEVLDHPFLPRNAKAFEEAKAKLEAIDADKKKAQ